MYRRRGRVNWKRLAFGVGKGRVAEDSSSEESDPIYTCCIVHIVSYHGNQL